jgi:hypothetical protein
MSLSETGGLQSRDMGRGGRGAGHLDAAVKGVPA